MYTRQVPLVDQQLYTPPGHLRSSSVGQSLVFLASSLGYPDL